MFSKFPDFLNDLSRISFTCHSYCIFGWIKDTTSEITFITFCLHFGQSSSTDRIVFCTRKKKKSDSAVLCLSSEQTHSIQYHMTSKSTVGCQCRERMAEQKQNDESKIKCITQQTSNNIKAIWKLNGFQGKEPLTWF